MTFIIHRKWCLGMVDFNKIKKEYISIDEVPAPHTRASQWDELFSSIQKGQALVLHEPEVNASSTRAALQRKQKEGKFKHLQYSSKGVHGSATLYISNTEKSAEKTVDKPIQRWAKQTTS